MRKFVVSAFLTMLSLALFGNVTNIPEVNLLSLESIHKIDNDWYFVPSENDKDTAYLNKPTDPWQILVPQVSNYYGSAWYLMTLNLENYSNQKIGFSLPVSFGAYQFFVNDNLVFEPENSFGNPSTFIEIPKGLLKLGENNLKLKVSSHSGWGGFSGFMEIGPYNNLNSKWMRYVFSNLFMGSVSLFLFLTFLLVYILKDRKRSHLFISLSSLAVAVFQAGFTGLWYYIFNTTWAYWLLTFIGGISIYLLPLLYVHSYLKIKLGVIAKIFTVFYSLLFVFTIAEYLITGQIFNFVKYLYIPFSLTYFLLIIYHLSLSIYAVRKKVEGSKTSLAASIILTLGLIGSVLCFALIFKQPPPIGESFFVMLAFYSFFQIQNISNKNSLKTNRSETLDVKNIV